MRLLIIVLFALVAVANAEKYAMVFGATNGWSNYPVYSVSNRRLELTIANLSFGG